MYKYSHGPCILVCTNVSFVLLEYVSPAVLEALVPRDGRPNVHTFRREAAELLKLKMVDWMDRPKEEPVPVRCFLEVFCFLMCICYILVETRISMMLSMKLGGFLQV